MKSFFHPKKPTQPINILYVNGWPFYDQLTLSSTLPTLKILSRSNNVNSTLLITPECLTCEYPLDIQKTKHIGLSVGNGATVFRSYFMREIKYLLSLLLICKNNKFDLIIARGSPAGGRVVLLSAITKIPFIVESFEPHSKYMHESGVWNVYSLKYLIQRLWEYLAMKNASALLAVSNNYTKALLKGGIDPKRIYLAPCIVDMAMFALNIDDRTRIRSDLAIPQEAIVGIYVGKFGGIYFDIPDALDIFSQAFLAYRNFYLIVLTGESRSLIDDMVLKGGYSIDQSRIRVLSVPHPKVPSYLSAADFSYALIKGGGSKRYCSPVKVGEYWANGLPVVIPEGVGDDSDIILKSSLGVLIGENFGWSYCDRLSAILSRSDHRITISKLADTYRSERLIIEIYNKLGF